MDKRIGRTCTLALVSGFLLGIHEGRLALWREEVPHPEQIYDIRVDTLPPADRLLLEKGIRAADRAEVWRFLENYLD